MKILMQITAVLSLTVLATALPAKSGALTTSILNLESDTFSVVSQVKGKITSKFNNAAKATKPRTSTGSSGSFKVEKLKPPTTPPSITHKPKKLSPGPSFGPVGSSSTSFQKPVTRLPKKVSLGSKGIITPRFNNVAKK